MCTDKHYEEIEPILVTEDHQGVCQSDFFAENPTVSHTSTSSVIENMDIAGTPEFEQKQVIWCWSCCYWDMFVSP